MREESQKEFAFKQQKNQGLNRTRIAHGNDKENHQQAGARIESVCRSGRKGRGVGRRIETAVSSVRWDATKGDGRVFGVFLKSERKG